MDGATHLRDLLTELDGLLRGVDAPVMAHVREGVPPERVAYAMGSVGLEVDTDVVTWFGWHDGTDTPVAVDPPGHPLTDPLNHLLAGLHLITLEQAVTELGSARALEPYPDRPIILGPGWFPFLKFSDGWLVCVDTHSPARPAPVFVWDTGAGYGLDTLQPWFPSVVELTETLVEAYRSGEADPRELVLDYDRLPASARRLGY